MRLLKTTIAIRLVCIGCALICLPGAVAYGSTSLVGRARDTLRADTHRPCAGGISGETSAQVRTLLHSGARRPAGFVVSEIDRDSSIGGQTSSVDEVSRQQREMAQLRNPLRHRVRDPHGDDPPA